MTFELLPIIDTMIDLYKRPANFDRFQYYLKILQGNTKGDLAIPIGGYNPMAKDHALDKLKQLKHLNAEDILEATIIELKYCNIQGKPDRKIKVAINLSDDLKGGWTNRFTSDYDSKFKVNALVNRNFCTPIFWTSENFTDEIVRERTLEYLLRTIYWLDSPKPTTLKEHLDQEKYVSRHAKTTSEHQKKDFKALDEFYRENEHSDSYPVIFNFFYGDKASASLEFPTYGMVHDITGFQYARALNQN